MLSHDPREDIIRSTSPDDSELPTKGWLGAVLAVAGRLTHVADRTVRQARAAAAAPEPPSAVSSPTSRRSPTAVDAVGEEVLA
jgi:hypothetical protein